MKRVGAVVIAIALVIYAALCGTLYAAQRSLLYYPTPEVASPRTRKRCGSKRPAPCSRCGTCPSSGERAILYFGGNSEDVAWNIDAFAAAFPNTDVYLMNYRGYGGSTGAPSEAALLADAEALFDEVRSTHPRVAVIGRSLGSGVAVHLASRARREQARARDAVRQHRARRAAAFRHRAGVVAAQGHVRLVQQGEQGARSRAVLLAEHDRVIPRAHSERLVTAFAPGQVEVRLLAGTNHDSIASSPEYRSALAAFLLY